MMTDHSDTRLPTETKPVLDSWEWRYLQFFFFNCVLMVTMVQDDNGLADGKPPYLLYINFHFSVKQASKYISKLVYEFPFIMDDPSIDAWYVQKSEIQSNVTWFRT